MRHVARGALTALIRYSSYFLLSSGPKKHPRIVFVSLSGNTQLPFRIANAKCYFKEQGLTVEPIFVRGGPIAVTALISGIVEKTFTLDRVINDRILKQV